MLDMKTICALISYCFLIIKWLQGFNEPLIFQKFFDCTIYWLIFNQ